MKTFDHLLKLFAFSAAFVLVLVCMPQPAHASVQASYYVNPSTGNDSNNGLTTSTPFQTIAKARDVIRTNYPTMTGDIMVYLMGGTYTQTSTLTFGSADSGKNGYSIKYVNYSGQIPVISGGTAITSSWTLHDSVKNIYKTNVGSLDFRQLYVNGTPAIRARTPNGNTKYTAVDIDMINKKIKINKSEISNWNNLTQVEFNDYFVWSNAKLRLSSYTTDATYAYLSFQNPESDKFFYWANAWVGCCTSTAQMSLYYFENAYELIDAEGEWYLDASTSPHTLYYKPRSGENMTNGTVSVVAPTLETLVSIEGTLSNPVQNLVFYGIKFAHAGWAHPSSAGFVGYQFFQYVEGTSNNDVNRPPGGVHVAAAKNITFERNTFEKMGAAGLDVFYGTENTRIVGNVFKQIAGTGVQLARFQPSVSDVNGAYNPSDTRDFNKNDVISNNYFTDNAREFQSAVPIAVGYGVGTLIEHNKIDGAPYSGIHVGGHTAVSTNIAENIIIRANDVRDFMQELNDGGAIYTKGVFSDYNISYENYMRMGVPSNNANANIKSNIYRDYGTSYFLDALNVVDNTPGYANYTYHTNNHEYIYPILIDKNYVTDTSSTNGPGTITNSFVYSTANWPIQAQDIIGRAGLTPAYSGITSGGAAPDYVTPTPPPSPPAGMIPTTGLGLWLKADAGVTKDGSNRVSDWTDFSGNGTNAATLGSTNKPLWVASAINGQPALRFDGTERMIAHDFVDIDMRDFTMTFVIKPSLLTDWNQIVGATNTWGSAVVHASANGTIFFGSDWTTHQETSSGQIETNKTQIFTYKFSNGTASLYKNGTLIASASGRTTGYPPAGFQLNTINGDVPEVIVYKTALSDTDRQSVEGYLTKKYMNIARNKTVMTSSNADASHTGAQAVDGDTSTFWAANGASFNQTFTVDLGALYSLSSVKQILFDSVAQYYYKIEGSTDNSSWTTLADHTSSPGSGDTLSDSASGNYRYVKITVTGASGGEWANAREVEVNGQIVNLAAGKTVTTSSNADASHTGAQAVDGNPTTFWAANGASFNQTFTVDLGATYSLSSVKQTLFDSVAQYYYKIEGSVNNSTWTTLTDHTSSPGSGMILTDSVSGSYRYVKITVTGASGGEWANAREVEVNGTP